MSEFHTSVLLQEIIDYLRIQTGKKYIDATLGGGGHAFGILNRGGIVLGIDVDEDAIEFVSKKIKDLKLKIKEDDILLVRGNFENIDEIAGSNGFNTVSGIVYDLGVSSHQLDTPERGFSFLKEAKLDMRMDNRISVKALDLINGLSKKELTTLFTKFGDEEHAWRIAGEIVERRKEKPITHTRELAGIIEDLYRRRHEGPKEAFRAHPATKVFQALRIAVNDELYSLEHSLKKSVTLLESGGRIAVISFHSLEDGIVKKIFLELEEKGLGSMITEKPVIPGEEEIKRNIRSRSAKLRVFEKN